jgi:predicted transposase/invertase (TIGR01784 family)
MVSVACDSLFCYTKISKLLLRFPLPTQLRMGKTGGSNMQDEQNSNEQEIASTSNLDNPDYDGGYKEEFANKKQFLHFLKKYVKADWAMTLREEDIELCDREFLLEDFQKRHADLVHRIHLQGEEFYIDLIMELQSQVDFTMPFRFLTLMFALMMKIFQATPEKIRQRKDFRLPAVIPVLFYNGKDPWSAEREFRKYVRGHEKFGTNVPNFEYFVIDLNEIAKDYILKDNFIIDYILALDKNRKDTSVVDILSTIIDWMKDLSSSETVGFIKWVEHVLIPAMTEQHRELALQKLQEMKGGNNEMIHHIQIQLQKDYKRNWEEGLSQGLEKGQELVAQKMLKKGLPLDLIFETTDVPMEKLYKMQEEILPTV